MTTALILAGGDKTRWGNHRGVPKHMVPIGDEPLIHYLQRQLTARGVEVLVKCRPEDVADFVTTGTAVPVEFEPEPWQFEWDDSRHVWPQHRLLILYGDCFYTPQLLDAVVADTAKGWRLYARWDESRITGKPWGEPWVWVIQPDAHAELDAAVAHASQMFRSGQTNRCMAWEVYRAAAGFNLNEHRRETLHGMEWSDFTEDFDFPDDYERWLERFSR